MSATRTAALAIVIVRSQTLLMASARSGPLKSWLGWWMTIALAPLLLDVLAGVGNDTVEAKVMDLLFSFNTIFPNEWAGHTSFLWLLFRLSTLIALPIGLYIGAHLLEETRHDQLESRAWCLLWPPYLGWLAVGQAGKPSGWQFAIPPIIAGAYSGVISSQGSSDAARAIGLTEGQILTQLEYPSQVPLILAGALSGTQVIATATSGCTHGGPWVGAFPLHRG